MRTGIASIILGALAVLLITSAVISSLVSLHFMSRQNTAAVWRNLTQMSMVLDTQIKRACTQSQCDLSTLTPLGGESQHAVISRDFNVLAGTAPKQLNYQAAIQDAFNSQQVQRVSFKAVTGVVVALVRPIRLPDQQHMVVLSYADVPENDDANERMNLILIQVANVFLILGFGVYLMRRTVILPIGELERWVRKRMASAASSEPPKIEHPVEIAQLRNAFFDLVQSLDSQQLLVEESRARLAQTQQELAHRDRLVTVGRVASGIAHEVGNPLSSAMGFVSLLKEHTDFEALGITEDEVIHRMDTELERVRKAVRRLLDLSRPVVLQPQDVLLSKVFSDIEMLIKVRNQKIKLHVEWFTSSTVSVYFDPGVLVQVLSNLCLNAIEAMGESGVIRLSVHASDVTHYEIVVSDEGPGIEAAVADVLFEPFQTTKRMTGGTGLGLSISRSLMESAGGTLALHQPQPQTGAAFILQLPRQLQN